MLQTYERRIKLKSLERLSDNVVRGTGAVLKNPLLLVGMMLISLLIKYPAEPDDAGRQAPSSRLLSHSSWVVEGLVCGPAVAPLTLLVKD